MSIETTMTRAWQRKAIWLWLLLPLSGLYALVILLRQRAYQWGWFASYRAPIPVMVIGNITVGGSGKTPLIISLVKDLQCQGIKVGVISRGYGGDKTQMPALVTEYSLPKTVGDEPSLIVTMTGVAMAVCPDREQAIATLLDAYPDIQLIIADDGLQHYALQRDIEWIVVDTVRGFGNGQLLPTGFLRDPISRLKGSTVIYHQKPNESLTLSASNTQLNTASLTMHLQPDTLQLLLINAQKNEVNNPQSDDLSDADIKAPKEDDTVHAVSGIGYPQRFFATLKSLGFTIIAHPYPDHHDFSLSELLQYTEHPIVITSKDAVKIKALWLKDKSEDKDKSDWQTLANRLWVLPVTAVLSTHCYDHLYRQLKALNIDTNTDR